MVSRPIVLVTGASKGIGAATAQLFASEGYDVCINYNGDEQGAHTTAQLCEATGARAMIVQADVSKKADVQKMFAQCDIEFGPIKCLVNNAGIIGQKTSLFNLTEEVLETTFRANVFGSIFCTQEAINQMSTKEGGSGGSIVNMSSIAAYFGSPNEYVHYAASKGAIETFTAGAGKELAPFGIRVNAIRVGTTNTSMHEVNGNSERPQKVAALTPMGRIAEPHDIAEAAFWLASERSGFVTGTCLTVAGGFAT